MEKTHGKSSVKRTLTTSYIASYWIALSPLVVMLFAIISHLATNDSSTFGLMSSHIFFYFVSFIVLFLCFDIYPVIIKEQRFESFKTTLKIKPELFILLGFFVWNILATILQILILGNSNALSTTIQPYYIQEGLICFFIYGMCVFFAHGIKDETVTKKILHLFLFSGLFISLIALLNPRGTWIVHNTHNTSWASLFINSNHFGHFLCISTTLSAGMFIFEKTKWKQILLGCMFGFFCLISCFADTFGSLIATFLTLIIMPVVISLSKKKFDWKTILPLVIFIAISFIAIPIAKSLHSTYRSFFSQCVNLIKEFFVVADSPTSSEAMSAGTNRWSLWMNAFKSILENPLIGNGEVLMRPHNEYLQYAVVWGIPSVLIYLSAFVVMLVKVIKHITKLSPLSLILGFCVFCYLISAIFGNTMPHVVPFFALLLGFFIRNLNKNIIENQADNN